VSSPYYNRSSSGLAYIDLGIVRQLGHDIQVQYEVLLRLVLVIVRCCDLELQAPVGDRENQEVRIAFAVAHVKRLQQDRRGLVFLARADLAQLWPRHHDKLNRVAVNALSSRDGDLHGGDWYPLAPRRNNGQRAPWYSSSTRDLEEVAAVTGKLWLHDQALARRCRHLGEEGNTVDLGGQLDLLYTVVKIEDHVLRGGLAEGQSVVLGDRGFGLAIVPEVCRLLAGIRVVQGMMGLLLLLLLLLLLPLLSPLEGLLQQRIAIVRAEGGRRGREDTGPAYVSR
jgi:hypothetical protein